MHLEYFLTPRAMYDIQNITAYIDWCTTLYIESWKKCVLCTFGIFCLTCDYIMEKRENFNAAVKKMFKESLNWKIMCITLKKSTSNNNVYIYKVMHCHIKKVIWLRNLGYS